MAEEDLATMKVAKTEAPATAADRLADVRESPNDVANRVAAAAAGVQHAAFINYDAALSAYGARPDIEDLAHKYARNAPDGFDEADFMRSVNADALDHGTAAPARIASQNDVAAPVAADYDGDGPEPAPVATDADGDGSPAGTDADDNNPAVQ